MNAATLEARRNSFSSEVTRLRRALLYTHIVANNASFSRGSIITSKQLSLHERRVVKELFWSIERNHGSKLWKSAKIDLASKLVLGNWLSSLNHSQHTPPPNTYSTAQWSLLLVSL
jgi:hypothetical protein